MRRISKFFRSIFVVSVVLSACTLQPDNDHISLQVHRVLELTTVSYTYKSVLYFADEQKFLGIVPLFTQSILFSVKTRVQAGIPLSDGFSVLRKSGTIVLTIPEPKVLLADADEDSLLQYQISEVGKTINWVDVGEAIAENKQVLIEDALQSGILQKAKENTRMQVKELMDSLGINRYAIEFKAMDNQDSDQSI